MVDPSPKSSKINSPPTALIKPQPKFTPPVEQPDIVKMTEDAKIDFVNVKDLIKGMEKPPSQEKKEKPTQKVEALIDEKPTQIVEALIDEKPMQKVEAMNDDQIDFSDVAESEQLDLDHHENGFDHKSNGFSSTSDPNEPLNNGSSPVMVPPKPMPRASISEGGAGEEALSNVNVVNGVPRPVARPRTTAQTVSAYKV